jgi:hypothetical protein
LHIGDLLQLIESVFTIKQKLPACSIRNGIRRLSATRQPWRVIDGYRTGFNRMFKLTSRPFPKPGDWLFVLTLRVPLRIKFFSLIHKIKIGTGILSSTGLKTSKNRRFLMTIHL